MFSFFESLIDPFRENNRALPRSLHLFLWHFSKQVWPVLAAISAVGLIVAIIEVMLFAFLGDLVDFLSKADRATFLADHGTTLLWMSVVLLVLRPLFGALHELLVDQAVVANLTNLVRWQSHQHMLGQSFSYFQNDFAGRIANKVLQTGPALREAVLKVIDAVWFMAVYLISAIVLFAANDVRLTAPLIFWILCYIAILSYFVPKIKMRAAEMSDVRSVVTGRFVDSYTNIGTVKLFAHASRELAFGRDILDEHTTVFKRFLRLISGMVISIICLNALLIFLIASLTIWLWYIKAISIGMVAIGVGLMLRVNNMAMWIMWEVTTIFENIGTVEDGMETIAIPHSVLDKPNAPDLEVTKGVITFDNVHFHYGMKGGVIDGVSLEVKPGEKVGLIGHSGAGKSTLIHLLLRLFDLEGGVIAIDGQDIAKVNQESLRRAMGVVTQDTSLLHRSVRDNIAYGRPEADMDAIIQAAEQAKAHPFIEGLWDPQGRMGYEAHVGERGVKLSGGQRQRIALARVLLKDAPILILDEATSALDSEVEAAIQEQLFRLMEGKTVIAIAHRLSTIAQMDRLIVLHEGHIAEEGGHTDLIVYNGLYAQLWAHQSGGFLGE